MPSSLMIPGDGVGNMSRSSPALATPDGKAMRWLSRDHTIVAFAGFLWNPPFILRAVHPVNRPRSSACSRTAVRRSARRPWSPSTRFTRSTGCARRSSPDQDVRDLAIQYLGTLPERFEPAVQQHKIDLQDPELPDVLREQLRLTPPDRRDYRGYDAEAVPILTGALKDEPARVSSHAASALSLFRRGALPALAALEEAAWKSPHVVTRSDSMTALVSIGPEGLLLVRRALNDPDPEMRACAKQVLEMAREKPCPCSCPTWCAARRGVVVAGRHRRSAPTA